MVAVSFAAKAGTAYAITNKAATVNNAIMRLMRPLLSLTTSLFPFPQRPAVIALRVHVVFDNVGHAVEAGEALGLRLC